MYTYKCYFKAKNLLKSFEKYFICYYNFPVRAEPDQPAQSYTAIVPIGVTV